MTEQNDQDGIGFFEKYLSLWVLICIITGILTGHFAGNSIEHLNNISLHKVNIPVAVLVWMMIYPMMVQVDLSSLHRAKDNARGLLVTLTTNWIIKPFSMAFFAWLFFDQVFAAWLDPVRAQEYLAGAILLGAAPCTAMVFVWSYLTKGNANYTLVQVSVNDIFLLIAYIPIVQLLLGITNITIPYNTLLTSVFIFVVIPLAAGYLSRMLLIRFKGKEWFNNHFLPALKPVSVIALLLTLILLFAFQGERILHHPLDILMIAVPLTVQTYVIFFFAWKFGRLLNLPHGICAPASMIGASNFFELAVAVAIALFGLNSGAALATVVGVLIEVPVMLSLVSLANRWRY